MKQAAGLLIASLCLNLLLLGMYVLLQKDPIALPNPNESRVRVVTNTVHRLIRMDAPLPTPAPSAPPAFTWRIIESEHYPIYIANLRRIGCPEKTIRDIILADVQKLYKTRASALVQAEVRKFWQTADQRDAATRARSTRNRELRQEKRALLKALLGFDEDPDVWLAWQQFSDEPVNIAIIVGYLPEDKQEHTYAVYHKYDDAAKEYREFASGVYTPADYKQQDVIYDQMKLDYTQLLAGDELGELKARVIALSKSLPVGMELTGDELRRICQLQAKAMDPLHEVLDFEADDVAERVRLARAQIAPDVKTLLGESRFADYQRGLDDRFGETFDFTEQNHLPRTAAVALYEVRSAAEDQLAKIQSDPTLAPAQKAVAQESVRESTLQAAAASLSEQAFGTYLNNKAGTWLKSMVQPQLPPLPPGLPGTQ